MDGHRAGCLFLKTGVDEDCMCGWLKLRKRQRALLMRTLSEAEAEEFLGPRDKCDESRTE